MLYGAHLIYQHLTESYTGGGRGGWGVGGGGGGGGAGAPQLL